MNNISLIGIDLGKHSFLSTVRMKLAMQLSAKSLPELN